jgi:hypothetical protein
MTGGACFACAPGHEALAAELAELVDGTWEITPGVAGVTLMANCGDRAPNARQSGIRRSVGLVAQLRDDDTGAHTQAVVNASPARSTLTPTPAIIEAVFRQSLSIEK